MKMTKISSQRNKTKTENEKTFKQSFYLTQRTQEKYATKASDVVDAVAVLKLGLSATPSAARPSA